MCGEKKLKHFATNYLSISVICLSRAKDEFSVKAETNIVFSVEITNIICIQFRVRMLKVIYKMDTRNL